ncbi:class I SAM-dependent methyltransferase [Gracilinema caldarium]|uniref:class I SAM-dependent methyltransferase n=1 Tax=Gracilinema caldarium TaxID=215591 RepID=UPI0026ED6CEA|nr:class I SAM-dependent methyltransferase [Gracilinema caldarium]
MSSFNPAYLGAKKEVDQRSLNLRVWNRFIQELEKGFHPTKILDLGAGNGSFLERLLKQTELRDFEYVPLDADRELLDNLLHTQDQELLRRRGIRIRPIQARIESFLEQHNQSWDLLISNAFFDLINLDQWGPSLFSLVQPGGLFYSTLLFDGVTTFLPPLDPKTDLLVEEMYHQSMQGRGQSGSRSGRTLLAKLLSSDLMVLEAGPSDWVIYAHQGSYTEGEQQLLEAILDFHQSVFEQNGSDPELQRVFPEWIYQRRSQLRKGELALLTHQWDLLAKK